MLRGCGWAMGVGASVVSRRLSDSEGSPKRRSREAPRAPAPGGGGGKLMALGGDGVGRCELLGGARTIEMLAGGVSTAMLTGLWLRGGEYGGGGSGAAGASAMLVASRRRAAGETTLGKERRERLFTLRLRSTGRGRELMTSLRANGGRGHPFLRVVGLDGALRRVALALALRIGKGGRDGNGRVRRIWRVREASQRCRAERVQRLAQARVGIAAGVHGWSCDGTREGESVFLLLLVLKAGHVSSSLVPLPQINQVRAEDGGVHGKVDLPAYVVEA